MQIRVSEWRLSFGEQGGRGRGGRRWGGNFPKLMEKKVLTQAEQQHLITDVRQKSHLSA